MKSLIVVALALGVTACGESVTFVGANGSPLLASKQDDAQPNQDPEKNNEAPAVTSEEPAFDLLEQNLRITSSDVKEDAREPVELLFILDNSLSMTDNIAKLRTSMQKLFSDLGQAQVPYTARIVSLDRLTNQLVNVVNPVSIAPFKLFNSGTPSYDRGSPYDEIYKSVNAFKNDQPLNEIDALFASVIDQSADIDNEPGICAALDYINWVEFNVAVLPTKFSPQQKMHIIMLSDEDNATTIKTIDKNTNVVTAEKDLICYQKTESDKVCTKEKYNVRVDWTGYGYEWNEPTSTRYRYRYKYPDASVCQARGVVPFPDGVDDLYKLQSSSKCGKYRRTCQDSSQPTTYFSCNAGGYTKSVTNNDLTNVYGRCEELQNFECEQYVDGQLVWRLKTRSEAVAIINNESLNLRCREPQTALPMWTAKDFALSDPNYNSSNHGIRGCQAYTCSVSSVTYPTVTIDQIVIDQNPGKYIGCGDQQLVEVNPYTVGTGTAGKLTALSKRSCASFGGQYFDTTTNAYYISNAAFCEKNLDANFDISSLGLSKTFYADSDPNSPAAKVTGWYPAPKTQSELATALGLNSGLISNFTEETGSVGGELVREYYTFDKYPAGSAFRLAKVGFKDLASGPYVGPQSEILNSTGFTANYPLNGSVTSALARGSNFWNSYVVEVEEKDPNGNMERDICSGTGEVKTTTYKPTPDNFLKLLKELHPDKKVTWHSIINLNGKSCSDSEESNVAQGKHYLALSKETKGLTADICDPDFKKFAADLTYRVISEINLEYALDAGIEVGMIRSIQIKGKDKPLEVNKDFSIDQGKITFRDGSVKIDDEIEIKYRKKSL